MAPNVARQRTAEIAPRRSMLPTLPRGPSKARDQPTDCSRVGLDQAPRLQDFRVSGAGGIRTRDRGFILAYRAAPVGRQSQFVTASPDPGGFGVGASISAARYCGLVLPNALPDQALPGSRFRAAACRMEPLWVTGDCSSSIKALAGATWWQRLPSRGSDHNGDQRRASIYVCTCCANRDSSSAGNSWERQSRGESRAVACSP